MTPNYLLSLYLLVSLSGFSQSSFFINTLGEGSNGVTEKNKMVEFAVYLDSALNHQIHNFTTNSGGLTINPFDPDQIDVQFDFWVLQEGKWCGPERRFGFYYQDYKVIKGRDVEEWAYEQVETQEDFRVRFTPKYEGHYFCRTQMIINGIDTIKGKEFSFVTNDTGASGFMAIHPNKRNFELDGKTFMPVGINLSHPRWMNDPNELRQGTAEYWYDIRKMPAMPIAYENYLDDIQKFAKADGNYFRMMLFPFVNDIEYEHLNNYSNRMHVAWEMDRTFEQLEKNDVRLHFVLTWANELHHPERCNNKLFWDWYGNNYPWVEDDFGYCYQHELGLKEPGEFLTNETAIEFYKKKLRYIMSRWGYSKAIGVVELMNEINLVFEFEHPKERMNWQKEIAQYLKNDLKISYPISVNYGGPPDIEKGDSSYYLNEIDLITLNEYRNPGSRANLIKHQENYSAIQKPFMFSEIGTINGLNGCESFSEWRKDMWMTGLCGMAGIGMEWFEQRNFKLMKENFLVFHKFSEEINFADFTQPIADIRKDRLAEVIGSRSSDGKRAIGVIHNTTWNYYTNRRAEGSLCAQTVPENSFSTYVEVSEKRMGNSLQLTDLHSKTRFRIDWYNTVNGELLESTFVKSNGKGQVRLSYPVLKEGTNLIAFKLYPETAIFSGLNSPQVTKDKIGLPHDPKVPTVEPTERD